MTRPTIETEYMPEEFEWGGFFTDQQLDKLGPRARWIVLVRSAHPKQMGHRPRLILLTLASYTSSDECSVGVERLARECAMSDRTVRDLLKVLEVGGWIERQRVSRRAPTITTLCWPNSWWFTDPESGTYGYRTQSGKEASALADAESGSSAPESGSSDPESGKTGSESGSQTAAECLVNDDECSTNGARCPSRCDRGIVRDTNGREFACGDDFHRRGADRAA